MNEFDIKATGWDQNPMHWDRSEAIASEIKRMIPLNTEMRVLEYGAGTGMTSFLLKDHVKEITMMDNSSEMVKVMTEKIKASKVKNLKVLNFNLEQSDCKMTGLTSSLHRWFSIMLLTLINYIPFL